MPRPPSARDRQQLHSQPSSIGAKSSENDACRRFKEPTEVIALPNRCCSRHACFTRQRIRLFTHSSPRWPYAVKHICSQRHPHDNVFGITLRHIVSVAFLLVWTSLTYHTHDISWLLLRQELGTCVHPVQQLSKLSQF